MKITVICQEIPYPAIHGSRIDMWRRIKAFADQGVELQAIFWWFGTEPNADEIAEIHKYVDKVYSIEIEQTLISRLRRISDLLIYPLETSSRRVKGDKLDDLINEVRKFSPDIIFLDGLHGGAIATTLCQLLEVPLVTRSHNIEYLYARRMLKSAIRFKDKFRRYLAIIHLEKYEQNILKKSDIFYDISADDLKFWQDRNFTNGRLLPPMIEFPDQIRSSSNRDSSVVRSSYDIVYLGNLSCENNVAGAIWFLTEVLPKIRDSLPKTTVLIAGLSPSKTIEQICERIPDVSLHANPKSASDIYQSGRILINPVLEGSGVKIKSIEMLMLGKPIVSTVEGVSGLPPAVKTYFSIANNSDSFAKASIEFLSTKRALPTIDRQLLESLFGSEIINNVIADIESITRH